MPRVKFPDPVTFDTFGVPNSHDAGLKVLEEAAELVEAVKGFEWSKQCKSPFMRDVNAARGFNRKRVLDEAMDVYQALANYIPGEVRYYIANQDFQVDPTEIDKAGALHVLAEAAIVYSKYWTVNHGASVIYDDAENAMLSLERLLMGEFSNDEIAEAYAGCVERNRERGRL